VRSPPTEGVAGAEDPAQARRAPEGAAPVEGEPPAPSTAPGPHRDAASEAALRRTEARRAWRLWLLAPVPLALLLWLDSVTAFLAAVAVLQIAVWPIYGRRRVRPARPGAALLAATPEGKAWMFVLWSLVLAALFVDNPAVRLLVCSVFATVAASAPAVRANVARVFLARETERRARAGAPTPVVWRLENPSRRTAVGLVVRDRLGIGSTPQAADLVFDAVRPGGAATASTVVVYERRGWRRFRPALVSSRFPLGLFSVTYETPAPAETLVHPREGRVSPALLARLRGASAASGRAVARRQGIDHFHGLREWREGDDPRRIHWRTTARRGQRTFMEWREEETRRVTVVLGASPGRGPDADRRFERAVSVVATVARACVRGRLPLRVVLGQDGEPVGGLVTSDPRRHQAVLDALAVVRADAQRRPETCLDDEETVRGATIVWVSARDEPETVERLERLRGRGLRVVRLRATDPGLSRWVRGLP
jgi:uncharacterized protein (DUF58 family)